VKDTEVTAGLAKSNGSLLPGLWRDSLDVTCVGKLYLFTFYLLLVYACFVHVCCVISIKYDDDDDDDDADDGVWCHNGLAKIPRNVRYRNDVL